MQRDVDRSESALVQSKHRVALLEESVAERERHAADVRREHKEAVEQRMSNHERALSERESALHQKEQRCAARFMNTLFLPLHLPRGVYDLK